MDPIAALSDKGLVEEFNRLTSRRTQVEAAGLVRVHQKTVSEWRRGTVRALQPETRRALEEVVRAAREAEEAEPEGSEWIDDMLGLVRHVNGEHILTPEQRRLVQLDLLKGMILLGKNEGKDVRKLEALRDALRAEQNVAEAAPELPSGAAVSPDTARRLDAIQAESPDELTRILRMETLAAVVRAEAMVEAERAAVIRARAIEQAELSAGRRAAAIEREAESSVTRADRLARPGPGFVISELSEDERRRIEFWRREQAKHGDSPPPPGESPGPRPGDDPPTAGA